MSTADLMISCKQWASLDEINVRDEMCQTLGQSAHVFLRRGVGGGVGHVTAAHQLHRGDVVIHRAAATM